MSGELVLPVALIVKGTGKRVKKEELAKEGLDRPLRREERDRKARCTLR
jgi:hypothetical protein